jgi:topoisomerase-4 subunit A
MDIENVITPDLNEDENHDLNGENGNGRKKDITYLPGMYKTWFLEYASYVILERAVPHLYDGLKPVQRRILHSMKRLDDGRFNKVANIVGHTMQFHPHGDASIGDALIQIGQKELLVETQGNWGNILTGDSAAAPRYIEARLSKFALEVVFNPKTTEWKPSYDGRNKEPLFLPVKFPLLLTQGVEGIAVGLASKILPHNFIELIDASIAHLRDEDFVLYPDFPTGGSADFSKYQDGLRGGKVRIRAKISKLDKRTLVVNEIPYGKTTSTIIDTILSANDKGKIKIKKIDDNTAENVEIIIHLAPDVSTDKTIDALYAFTDCEVSVSPNSCVINDDRPVFLGVSEILRTSTDNTVALLKEELLIRKNELEEDWHNSSLEKIFIENRIYLTIEDCETWECIIKTIDDALDPFKKLLKRKVTEEDITKLTEIKIKRISKFDAFKADEHIKAIDEEMETVQYHLDNLIQYAIDYFKSLKKRYSKGRQRKTEIRNFDTIEATKVVVANQKLYVNYEEGFIGTSLKKDEYLFDCSDIDDIIVFRKDGTYVVTKVSSKAFIGKNLQHIAVFKKNDSRTIYNVVYRDGKNGTNYIKRFAVTGVTRDKEYDLTRGSEGSRIIYFSANPNGEAEVIRVVLKPKAKLKKTNFEFDFSELNIKNKNAMGNILTKHSIHKLSLKEKGISTLGGRMIWFDTDVKRLNADERGDFLGEFLGDDQILVLTKDGQFRLSSFELTNHYEEDILRLEKFDPNKVFTCIFFDADQEYYYLKRFQIDGSTNGKLQSFIGDNPKSRMIVLSDELFPNFEIRFGGQHSDREAELLSAVDFISLKSFKARGKRLTTYEVKKIVEEEPTEPSDELIAMHYGEDFFQDSEKEDQTDAEEQTGDKEDPSNHNDSGGESSSESSKAPVIKPDSESKTELETKSETEPKPEAKVEPKVETKSEQKSESVAEQKMEPEKSPENKVVQKKKKPSRDTEDNSQMTLGL